MKSSKSVFYNFIMNVILTMSSFIFPLITFPYTSRILLPIGTGKVAFANSVVNYFLLLAQLGIPTYGIRACAKVRENEEKLSKTVQEILVINLFMCVISYVLFFIILYFVPRFQDERTLLIITSGSILFTTLGVEWFFKNFLEIGKRSYIKRVIALPGEHVQIKDGKVYINDKELKEDYLQAGIVTDILGNGFDDFTVPENCVFAMGDNRNHSTDCRAFGCIPLEKIESTVAIRIWPLEKWGKVK